MKIQKKKWRSGEAFVKIQKKKNFFFFFFFFWGGGGVGLGEVRVDGNGELTLL